MAPEVIPTPGPDLAAPGPGERIAAGLALAAMLLVWAASLVPAALYSAGAAAGHALRRS